LWVERENEPLRPGSAACSSREDRKDSSKSIEAGLAFCLLEDFPSLKQQGFRLLRSMVAHEPLAVIEECYACPERNRQLAKQARSLLEASLGSVIITAPRGEASPSARACAARSGGRVTPAISVHWGHRSLAGHLTANGRPRWTGSFRQDRHAADRLRRGALGRSGGHPDALLKVYGSGWAASSVMVDRSRPGQHDHRLHQVLREAKPASRTW
jgi:hypothetical protein